MARPYEAISTPPMRAGVRSWAQRGRFREALLGPEGKVPGSVTGVLAGPSLRGCRQAAKNPVHRWGWRRWSRCPPRSAGKSRRVQAASAAKNRRPVDARLIVVLGATVSSCRRRGRRRRGRRCRPGRTGNGRGPWCKGRCGGRDGGGRRRGVITGPSAGGDHGDDDGGDDDDRRGRDGYPLAAALLLGTIAIRPLRPVPVALDLDVAAGSGYQPAG